MALEFSISAYDDNTGEYDGSEIFIDLTNAEASDNMNVSYNNKMNMGGIFLFWETCPLGANVSFELYDDEDNLLCYIVQKLRLKGTNTSGLFLGFKTPTYICDGHYVKMILNNGPTKAAMSCWAAFVIERFI